MLKELEQEYKRQSKFLDAPFSIPQGQSTYFVQPAEVLRLHFLIADEFASNIESDPELNHAMSTPGVKNHSLLSSAIARQFPPLGVEFSSLRIAAEVFFGIISNHPFHDANKRTALLTLLVLLRRNDYSPAASQKTFEDLAVFVADGRKSQLLSLVRKQCRKTLLESVKSDTDTELLEKILRLNTRKNAHHEKSITFRQLLEILKRFGWEQKKKDGNFVTIEKKVTNKFLGIIPISKMKTKRIPFPGDSKTVKREKLIQIRKDLELTSKDGIDSDCFYDGADEAFSIISDFKKEFRSLANR